MVVERALAAEGRTRQDIGREAFEARVWEWKRQYGASITGQLRRLAASCDWSRERFTLDEGLSGAFRWVQMSTTPVWRLLARFRLILCMQLELNVPLFLGQVY